MIILARTRLACRILHYLATCPGGVAKQVDIARAVCAPKPYTGKVARELLFAGFVKSVRGHYGGYALALPASSIRLGDVVQFVDDTRSWRSGSNLDDVGLRAALKEAQDRFFDVLNEHSIADLSSQAINCGNEVASTAHHACSASSDRSRSSYSSQAQNL
jgi:Rrf2 family protein